MVGVVLAIIIAISLGIGCSFIEKSPYDVSDLYGIWH